MTSALSDPTIGTSRTVGRYFGLVSVMPSLLFSGYAYLLVASGAWSRRPDLGSALAQLQQTALESALALVGLTLVVALALHNLQFAIVQFLEGYWGGSATARYLRAARTASHVARLVRARHDHREASQAGPDAPPITFSQLTAASRAADALHVLRSYPEHAADVMPTRLGNVLRRYEVKAGAGYRVDVLARSSHLALVAPPNHVAYLNDQRSALDLAVRLSATGALAAVITVVIMWPWDVWLLMALLPYVVAYVSYRGAIVAAGHYGDALTAIVDLNRFRMYEALHLGLPRDTQAERLQNEAMDDVMSGAEETNIRYHHGPHEAVDQNPDEPESEGE